MQLKRCGLPPSGGAREQDSLIVRRYTEPLEGLGLSARITGTMIGTARHIAVWIAAGGLGLDRFDIRLLESYMHHECRCPDGQKVRSAAQTVCDPVPP